MTPWNYSSNVITESKTWSHFQQVVVVAFGGNQQKIVSAPSKSNAKIRNFENPPCQAEWTVEDPTIVYSL